MKIQFRFIFLILFALIGCKEHLKVNKIIFDHLNADSIVIINTSNLELNPSLIKTFESKGVEYISYLNTKHDSILLFSLKNTNNYRSIKINCQSNKLIDYKIKSFDSIYVLMDDNDLILTSNTKTLIKYKIKDSIEIYKNNYTVNAFYDYPLEIQNDTVFLYFFPNNPIIKTNEWNNYFKTKRDHLLKIDHGNIHVINNFGAYPSEFYKDNYYIFSPIRTLTPNSLIYSLPNSNKINVIDLKSGKSSIITLETNGFKDNISFSKSKINDFNYISLYLTENDRFGLLKYDKFNNKFIRVLEKKTNYINTDGTINKWIDKPFSLLIYDCNFKLEKEIEFPGKTFDFRNILVFSDGIYLQKVDNFENKNKEIIYAKVKIN